VILVDSAIKVTVDEKNPVERSLRKFKRMVEAYGVVREYRKRQEYKKPSVRNKEKVASAEKRRRKLGTRRFSAKY